MTFDLDLEKFDQGQKIWKHQFFFFFMNGNTERAQ